MCSRLYEIRPGRLKYLSTHSHSCLVLFCRNQMFYNLTQSFLNILFLSFCSWKLLHSTQVGFGVKRTNLDFQGFILFNYQDIRFFFKQCSFIFLTYTITHYTVYLKCLLIIAFSMLYSNLLNNLLFSTHSRDIQYTLWVLLFLTGFSSYF